MSFRVRLAIVLLVTVASLGWALWMMDLSQFAGALASYRPLYLIPPFVIFSITFVIRSWRFQALLDHPLRLRHMMSVMAVSFLAINVMPLRMGELVRPYLLVDKHGVPLGKAMAAVVLERLHDILALLVLILVTGWVVDIPVDTFVLEFEGQSIDLLQAGLRAAGGAALIGLLGVVGVVFMGHRAVDLLVPLWQLVLPSGMAEKVEHLARQFVDGLRALWGRPLRAVGTLSATVALWVGTLLAVASMIEGFPGLTPTLDLVLFSWTACITAMTMVPTPGFIGPFEAACVTAMGIMGVDATLAGTYALVLHAVILAFNMLLGGVAVAVEGWSLTGLVRSSRSLGSGT